MKKNLFKLFVFSLLLIPAIFYSSNVYATCDETELKECSNAYNGKQVSSSSKAASEENTKLDSAYDTGTIQCGDIEVPKALPTFVRNMYKAIKILIPIILIISGIFTFVKGVTGKDAESSKKLLSEFLKKLIFAVLVFFVLTLVQLVLQVFSNLGSDEEIEDVNESSTIDCINCFLSKQSYCK